MAGPGIWVSWTPTVTQSGSVTRTVTYAKYAIVGNMVTLVVELDITGSGTTNNAIIIGGQPVAIQPARTDADHRIGDVTIADSGVGTYEGAVMAVGVTDFRFRKDDGTNYMGISPNFGLANGDKISFNCHYER